VGRTGRRFRRSYPRVHRRRHRRRKVVGAADQSAMVGNWPPGHVTANPPSTSCLSTMLKLGCLVSIPCSRLASRQRAPYFRAPARRRPLGPWTPPKTKGPAVRGQVVLVGTSARRSCIASNSRPIRTGRAKSVPCSPKRCPGGWRTLSARIRCRASIKTQDW
jgi:hypothetical protein